ncbi:MAG: GHKL domain-containing protein [Magnetospirillum sp.]|nr:GHKL domain-containing protein [Magnetospirillum sp.]
MSGDHMELVRLFQNLLGNAIKYRSPARPLVLSITAARDGGWWTIAVKDNGIGIAAEHFERIFRVFQRLHGHGEYEGTGIGLASCKKIAEHHGGRIWVESSLDQGSEFFVSLPALHEPAA